MTPAQQMAIHEATRSSLLAQMENLRNFVEKKFATADIDALQTRKVRAGDLMKNFMFVEGQMFQVDPSAASKAVDFSELYYTVDANLSKLIRKLSEQGGGNDPNSTMLTSTATPNSPMDIRLPKITIEPFAGNYTQWQPFYDLYLKTIHNSSLTAVQKFTYLKGYLRDEAANLIKHFPVTEANYFEAFKKLVDRYGRKKHTINAFIRSFLDQPCIKIATSNHIRKLLDVSDETIRGLKSLGEQAESRDVWLLYLMEAKLDSETKLLWAQHSCEMDNPSVEIFFKFLLNRSDALEAMKGVSSKDYSSSIKSTKSFVANPTNMCNKSSNSIKCLLCSGEHYLCDCIKFKQMSVRERRECVKSKGCCFNCLRLNHAVFKCRVKVRCMICHRKHSTLLHMDDDVGEPSKTMLSGKQTSNVINEIKPISNQESLNKQGTSVYQSGNSFNSSLLPTALVNITDTRGTVHICRILLDTGSMSSFISEKCCNQLGLARRHNRTIVSGIGGSSSQVSCGEVQVILRSLYDPMKKSSVTALVLSKLCNRLPSHSNKADKLNWSVFLADPEFSKGGHIDIILGVQLVFESLLSGRLKINDELMAVETIYGWVLGGDRTNVNKTEAYFAEAHDNSIDRIDELLQKFWQVETVPECQKLTAEEVYCEEYFRTTTSRNADGRFIIRLPVKKAISQLGASLNLALSRQASMERKFSRNPSFALAYKDFISEYVDLGHMIQGSCDISKNYLPHHGVTKESSTTTKLRVVFDGSARTASGMSLNETLMAGPIQQASLYQILVRFREFKFAMVCDVEKMYRQILVHQDDRNLQQIVWRSQPTELMKYFELATLTYGMKPAPYLATRVLEELARLNENEHPEVASTLRKHTYIDDVMTGGNSLTEAIDKRRNLIKVLASAGMRLRKWVSNSAELLEVIPECDKEILTKQFEDEFVTTKVLGLQWNPVEDVFSYKIALGEYIPTKRGFLSESSRIFDPLGWLTPMVIKIKIMFQQLWLKSINWDDPLPGAVESDWLAVRSKLADLKLVKIPRWLQITSGTELHGFCDASKNAYACVIYAKHQNVQGEWCIRLIAAKSRVAPIKTLTIARLELCAAVLLVQLMKSVEESLCTVIHQKYYWTDSSIVLDWLSDVPVRWEIFVANRTSKILEDTRRENWFHVPTKRNVADCASRGLWPGELVNNDLWWNGPSWLMNKEEWPEQQRSFKAKTTSCFVKPQENEDWLENVALRVSSFHTIIKIITRLKRMFRNAMSSNRNNKLVGPIQREELVEAELICWKHLQKRELIEDITNLSKSVPLTSTLKFLNPFIDENGVVRVGGRLQNANVPENVKHPIIIPTRTKLAKRLVEYYHAKYHHAGSQLLLGLLRQNYWLIRGKDVVRKVIRECIRCFKVNPVPMNQQMGNLPSYRVEHLRPFIRVGVDFAGPFMVYLKRGRGQKPTKIYICIFVCESTKAVHIELVSDLTTGAFLAAFRRFVGRRGLCTDVYSDCGTNFIGANKELQNLFKFIKNNTNDLYYALLKDNIKWHFMPPNAPHFGGLWEAAVKSFKFHFKRVVGATIMTLEEMMTLAVEIEAILNSRPLCGIPDDEYQILTPAHFLLGHSMLLVPEYKLREIPMNKLDRWQLIQQRKQHFWTRWSLEYLTALQSRYKWQTVKKNIQLNDVVLIIDNNLPPTKWLMGKVIELIQGKDGLVRITNIQTKSGVLKRPIHKLCKLPVESTDSRAGECLK